MPRHWRLRISDIVEAIERIEQYTKGLDTQAFDNDPKIRDATLYNLMIVGEASSNIPEEVASKYPEIPWVDIRGMRNVIAHGYFAVKQPIIWKTVTEDLPRLKAALGGIIEENSS